MIDPEQAKNEIMELESAIYADPMNRKNVGDKLAADFWEVSREGRRMTREEILKNLAESNVVVDEYPIDQIKVEVHGDTVISTGRAIMRARAPMSDGTETPIERDMRYVHVWVQRDGMWQCVYGHNSPAI